MYRYILLFACISRAGALFAQTDSTAPVKALQEVVVTATRNEQLAGNVPIPVTIVNKQQLRSMGAVLLQQVLAEQTGVFITPDHGTGVQMQGLDAQYALILLNGEPLIGRTAGTLDLSRIMVGNIERIEIIKGPVSSLYGSDALAGVINIITDSKSRQSFTSLDSRYATNNTFNANAETRLFGKNSAFSASAGYLSSDGYTLGDGGGSPTSAPFSSATFQSRWQRQWAKQWQTSLSGRYYRQRYDSWFQDTKGTVDDTGKEQDANLSLQVKHTPNKGLRQTFRLYYSRYHTQEDMIYRHNGEIYDTSYFTQQYLKPEYQLDWQIHPKHLITAGLGHVRESVEATRYDDKMAFNTGYLFVQENWQPADRWNVLLGGRFDLHDQYPSQFSPKLSLSYRFLPQWRVMASAGRGYRAPDFRQLYLHFNNAAVGYTVAGARLAKEILLQMQQQGLIRQLNVDPNDLGELDAESSWSYNVGIQGKVFSGSQARVNFFYNNVSNLIDTRAIAEKTNGQRVFSYINLKSISTWGTEAEWEQRIGRHFRASAGYQYLMSRDNQLYQQVKNKQIYTQDETTHEIRALKKNEYFGLFNRSRHTGNIKLSYLNTRLGLDLNARLLYRGKYGFADGNGNQAPDTGSEFVKGYGTVNVAAAKTLLQNRLRIQGTVENLFGYTNAAYIPTLYGRLFSVAVGYHFNHSSK